MADIFQGLTIALCGSFDQPHCKITSTPFEDHSQFPKFLLTRLATLGKNIQNAGGRYSASVNQSVTHLVATAKALLSNSSKSKFTFFSLGFPPLVSLFFPPFSFFLFYVIY